MSDQVVVPFGSRKGNLPAGLLKGLKQAVVAGDEAGDITVTGIKADDELVGVTFIEIDTGAVVDVADLTSEFTVKADDTINNTDGTDTTGSKLQVWWMTRTA